MLALTPPRADHRRTSDFPRDRRKGWRSNRAPGDAFADAWSGPGRDAWSRSRPALDRELRRHENLVARGATHTLLNTLSPRIQFDRGRFVLDGRVQVPVGNRKIVLAPMISA